MTQSVEDLNIGIIGGCGHIGLPLGILLAEKNYSVTLIDVNENSIDLVNAGYLPFIEKGAEMLLQKNLKAGKIKATSNTKEIKNLDIVIITIGTPVDEFQSPVTKVFSNFISSFDEFLHAGQLVILRSTVFPGTTQWLADKLRGKEIDVVYCPERTIQGNAIEEISNLSQIIAAENNFTFERTKTIFSKVTPLIVKATYAQAEFAKLFLNAYRYIQFAATNEFFMIANKSNEDYAEIHRIMTENYPRGQHLPSAGFSAGPCLLKDTQQLIAFAQNRFLMGNSAVLTNEGLALHIVEICEKITDLKNARVGILGMAFKANIDDNRASLSYRVKKMLQLKAKQVLTSDPFVDDESLSPSSEYVIKESDVIIICTPHDCYSDLDLAGKKVIDVWNINKQGLIFE